MSAKDGGQAFPMYERDDALKGMSLRDWFAGQVIAAIYTQSVVSGMDALQEHLAQEAYEMADAMLEARKA